MMMAMRVLSFARCYLIHKKSISESKAQMFCFPCAQDEHLCKILSYAHKSHLWKESLDAHFLAKEETIRREAAVSSDLQQEEEEDVRWQPATGVEEEQQGCRTTCRTNNLSSLGCAHLILLCLSGSCCQGWMIRRVG
ncbi:hypothetical protein CY35_04G142500 [Sphagnum magellanicum]|nr:hypothetical protein CY35_04G142500 [Sphagnum magellanicum]